MLIITFTIRFKNIMEILIEFNIFSSFTYQENDGKDSYIYFRYIQSLNLYKEYFYFKNNLIEYINIQSIIPSLSQRLTKTVKYYAKIN